MDHLTFKSQRFHLLLFIALCIFPGSLAQTPIPRGCGDNVDSLYFNLCDLTSVWGVVVEAFAAAGLVASLILLIVLLASLPFITDREWRSSLGLHAGFLIFTFGLFALTFAFIVGKNFATCASAPLSFRCAVRRLLLLPSHASHQAEHTGQEELGAQRLGLVLGGSGTLAGTSCHQHRMANHYYCTKPN